jgi:hypothetical protein
MHASSVLTACYFLPQGLPGGNTHFHITNSLPREPIPLANRTGCRTQAAPSFQLLSRTSQPPQIAFSGADSASTKTAIKRRQIAPKQVLLNSRRPPTPIGFVGAIRQLCVEAISQANSISFSVPAPSYKPPARFEKLPCWLQAVISFCSGRFYKGIHFWLHAVSRQLCGDTDREEIFRLLSLKMRNVGRLIGHREPSAQIESAAHSTWLTLNQRRADQ